MKNKFCQSCGMPLKKDPKQGGTNADASHNEKYCSYCYVAGKFTGNFTNVKEMQKYCIEKLVEKKTPRAFAWLLTRNLPRLERWRNLST